MTPILTAYFTIFPLYYFLLLISFYICAIIIYTLYSYIK